MNNCCLKYTDWLSDLILDKKNIKFSPDLSSLIQPFDPEYSGIWRPLITNVKKIGSSEYLLPYNINPKASGNDEYLSSLLGYPKFITIRNSEFRNWTVTGIEQNVDIGMNYENAIYYIRRNNRNNITSSIQSKKINNFFSQTINVIRNKLNDESKVTEPTLLSANGSIPRIDSSSNIEKIEVIPRAKIFGLEATNNQLISMFNANIGNGGIQLTFSGNPEFFKYLSVSEYISLDYTIFTKKRVPGQAKPRTGQYSIRVLVFGGNDLVPPVVVFDESKNVNLNENIIPFAKGSIVIEDQDLSQEIYVYVDSVNIGGSLEGSRSSIEDIKNMLVFNKSTLRSSITKKQTVDWIFNGGTENFSYLNEGETLTLNYKLYIYDNLGKYTEYQKSISIIGKNEPPGIGVYSIEDTAGGIYDLNDPKTVKGTLSISDIDYGDSIQANVIGVSLDYSINGAGDDPQTQFLSMLDVSANGNKLTWNFNPNINFLNYLSGGEFVQANYAIMGTDGAGGKGYGTVTILIIGKNIDVETSLPNIDIELPLTPITSSNTPTESIKYEEEFTINDLNKNDFVNVSILYCEYSHINVEDKDIPKNLDIKRMVYFVPINPKNKSNTTGTYLLVFDSSPENFRYLDKPNKKAILFYKIIVSDSYGSYKIKDLKFTIVGPTNTIENTNNKDTSIKFADYIWGWYRHYDLGRKNDPRHIVGVDFYFGDIDNFLFYGEPEFLIPQTGNFLGMAEGGTLGSGYSLSYKEAYPSGYIYLSGRLIIKNNVNDLITSKNLDNFFINSYEKSGVLSLLKTHPYIDLVTHNLTDTDSFGYTRDEYGRILPFVSGLSAKEYHNIGKQKFVSKTEDIAYRLADKYGLRMIAKEAIPGKAVSKFMSCTGPNISIHQINKIYHKKDTTDFSFLDTGIVVGDIKYDKQLAKPADNSPPIKLNSELMKSSPIIDYGPCGVQRDFLLQSPYESYTGYNISNYYFNIVDYRLNNELFHQEYVINNISGNYSGINKNDSAIRGVYEGLYVYTDVNASLILDTHGHGGIKDRCLKIVYASGSKQQTNFYSISDHVIGNIFFDPLYPVENTENIETTKKNITLNYYANPNSEGEIGNINIEYLRSPSKPLCRSFIEKEIDDEVLDTLDIVHTTPNSFRFDFRNNYYISRAYVPSVTTYYIPPSGFYYANHYAQDRSKIGVHFENHPNPRTPLTKTHDLAVLNPLQDETVDFTNLFTLSYNGTFNFKYNISYLEAGRIYLYSVAPSGQFIFSLLPNGDNVVVTGTPSGINETVYLDFDPKIHNKARIQVSMSGDCDNWTTKLSHEKLDYLKLPLISKLDVDTNIGFFHPNSGWLDASKYPKYKYKTPMAPYAPAPLDVHQNNLEKNELIRPDHYFWYDAEKMYSEEYLDGINLIIDTSGMVKPLVDIIEKAQYVAFLDDESKDFYYVTPDFYLFDYIEEDSPIKQSIRMSYLHIDYSYWYPFNNFIYSLVDPKDKRKIAVYSLSDNKRCFSYFDDQLYNSETVVLANHETINAQNQIDSINQTIKDIANLISITTNQINDFSQQISIISINITISAQDKAREILKLQTIINSLGTHISTLNNNISLLQNRLSDLTNKSSSFFSSPIISSSGNGESLILTLGSPVPDYLVGGGFIKKDISVDKHQSLLLYRSNITRNDPEIKVGKWGNIIAGKDVSEYNNSILRQNKWNQSALFFNFNPQNSIIASSGYYFPYSYATNRYNVTGSKIYKVIPNEYNEKYNFEDYGLISSVSGRLSTYIYAGPYQGNVLLSRVPKRQLMQLPSGEKDLECRVPPSGISKYAFHNLRGGDFIKLEKTSEVQKNIKCFSYDSQYIVSNDDLRIHKFYPSNDSVSRISCKTDPDPDTQSNIFILNTINPKFNIDVPCLGKTVIKYNNFPVSENHNKPKTPVFYELDYKYDNIFPYLTRVLPFHGMLSADRRLSNHLSVYDKFLGTADGTFFTYVDDNGAKDRDGLIKTTRCSFYNHNDAFSINNYSNIVGDDSPMERSKNPNSPAGLSSLLMTQTSNNDLLDSVIDSLNLQVNTLVNTINVLNYNLSDTSKNNIEKNNIIQNIQQINNQINIISQKINNLNNQKTNPPPPTYINWDKIPTQVNVGFPENKYKAKNLFIDMHMFSKSNSNDARFQPTFFNGKPSPSGYVYFEGLVEPPLSSGFYKNMITKYNLYKKWIDIPKNAKWGIMHKNGKVFWQNTVYSVQKTFETSCDSDASKCDLQKPRNKNVCGTARLLDSSNELFQILKMNPTLFETKDVTLPGDCGNISYCCNTMSTIESSNLTTHASYMGGNKQSECDQQQRDSIKECSESYFPQNSSSFTSLFCYDQYCPQPSGSGGYPIGSLSGTNYGLKNQLEGETVAPISGRVDITGESLIMFRLNPVDIKTFIIPDVTKKITFIDSTEPLHTPDTRIDNTLFNHKDNVNDVDIPFSGVGYVMVESGNRNKDWLQKYCSYIDLIESGMYYFKYINENNSKFIDLKANNSGLIWKNEMLYRDHVPHSGCFYGFMGEYDIFSNLDNNPFYKAQLVIDGRMSEFPLKNLTEPKDAGIKALCQQLKDLKNDCVEPGPLYETHILDGNYNYIIKVALLYENDRLLTEYNMTLGDRSHLIKIEHTTNTWDYLLYHTNDSDCESFKSPKSDKNILDGSLCYDTKKTFELIDYKHPFKNCEGNRCPEEWIYCSDETVNFDRVIIHTDECSDPPPPPLGGCLELLVACHKEAEKQAKSYKLGRSKESCDQWILENNGEFPHSYNPLNYFYATYDYSTWLCFPEPDYKTCYKYAADYYISFIINVYHNLIEIILPEIGGASWPITTKRKNRFYISRNSANSLFPIVKTYMKNENISINSLYRIYNNQTNYLGEIIFKDD